MCDLISYEVIVMKKGFTANLINMCKYMTLCYSFFSCFSRIDLHGTIKVADFGLTEDMYGTNYFRRQKSESESGSEEKVPIRWMAPESIENNIYNESSDVVSILV